MLEFMRFSLSTLIRAAQDKRVQEALTLFNLETALILKKMFSNVCGAAN
jgi:hypothetical protein